MPSGACEYRPLSTFRAVRGEVGQRDSALSHHDTQGRSRAGATVTWMATVTPVGDHSAPRAIRGQVRGMRLGKMLSGTRLAKSHTGVPRLRGKVGNHWASLCLPTPEILKTHSAFSELNY